MSLNKPTIPVTKSKEGYIVNDHINNVTKNISNNQNSDLNIENKELTNIDKIVESNSEGNINNNVKKDLSKNIEETLAQHAVIEKKAVKTNEELKPLVNSKDILLKDLKDLNDMLAKIEKIKTKCVSSDDWRSLMIHVLAKKTEVSKMLARAKRIYVQDFAESYDSQFENLLEGQKVPAARTAEIRAKSQAGISYEVAERMDKTWKDLEQLIWLCRDIASSKDKELMETSFEAEPAHLFDEI